MSPGGGRARPSFFVAFPFPHRAAVEGLGAPPSRVRVLEPVDLHLTLAFFGDAGMERALAGFAAIDPEAMEPVEVTLGGARLLGNPRHPTAIARLLEGGDAAIAAYIGAQRARALAAAGCPPDTRAPLAHLTIARIGRRATHAERDVAEAWTNAIAPSDARLRIDRVALYTWSERREGELADEPARAKYRIIDEHPLGSPLPHDG